VALLPNVYLIGAPKAGTTSLSRWLESHHEVFFCRPKEPSYWADDYPGIRAYHGIRTLRDYESLYASPEAQAVPHRVDGSTSYLYSTEAVPAIVRAVPDAKFIVAIRNPPDLLASLHRTQLIALNEDEPDFALAWRRSLAGRLPQTRFLDASQIDYPLKGSLGAAAHRLLQVASRSNVHFVRFEKLARTPEAAWRDLAEFLELSDETVPSFEVHNSSTKMYRSHRVHRLKHRPPRPLAAPVRALRRLSRQSSNPVWIRWRGIMWQGMDRPKIDPRMASELTEYFADDVQLLANVTGLDLSDWGKLTTLSS
jgi:hypothetical protein